MAKPPLIQFIFRVKEYRPNEPPQLQLLEPESDVLIAVKVPSIGEYIENIDEIITAQLSGEDKVKPLLTPMGWQYIKDKLSNKQSSESKKSEEENIQWEDE